MVGVKDQAKMKDKWDIFDVVMPVPGPERVAGADSADQGRESLHHGRLRLLPALKS